jgi:hypothetical protein
VTGVDAGDEVEGADAADVEAGGELEEAVGVGDDGGGGGDDGGGGDGDPTTPGSMRCKLAPEGEIVSE